MREYTVVSIAVMRKREGFILERDYSAVIHEYAAAGWEFVQAIPLEQHAQPRFDLVFSRKAKK